MSDHHISTEQYEMLHDRNMNKDDNLCNTDKTLQYSCIIKCKTAGILVAASNCSIV